MKFGASSISDRLYYCLSPLALSLAVAWAIAYAAGSQAGAYTVLTAAQASELYGACGNGEEAVTWKCGAGVAQSSDCDCLVLSTGECNGGTKPKKTACGNVTGSNSTGSGGNKKCDTLACTSTQAVWDCLAEGTGCTFSNDECEGVGYHVTCSGKKPITKTGC